MHKDSCEYNQCTKKKYLNGVKKLCVKPLILINKPVVEDALLVQIDFTSIYLEYMCGISFFFVDAFDEDIRSSVHVLRCVCHLILLKA